MTADDFGDRIRRLILERAADSAAAVRELFGLPDPADEDHPDDEDHPPNELRELLRKGRPQ